MPTTKLQWARRATPPIVRVSLLAAGLLAPAFLPAARGAEEPAPSTGPGQAPTTRPERPEPGASGERPGAAMLDRLHSIVTGLSLTDDQKPKIEEQFEKARKALEDLRGKPPADGAREAVGKALGDLRTGVGGLLTEDQKKEMREKLVQAGFRGQGGGAGRPGPLAVFRENMEKLGLSDDQKTKIESILKETQEKVQELVKDAQGDRQAVGEKIRPVIEASRQKILDMLTDDQKAKLKELAPQLSGRPGQGEPAATTKKAE